MVVGQEHAAGPGQQGVFHRLPQAQHRHVRLPLGQHPAGQDLSLAVHAQLIQLLRPLSVQQPQEIGPGLVHGGHDLLLPARPPGPVPHGAYQPQQHRRVLPHALHLLQLLLRGGQHPVQGAELLQQPVGGLVGVPAGDGVKQGQLQQLMVGHALGSVG